MLGNRSTFIPSMPALTDEELNQDYSRRKTGPIHFRRNLNIMVIILLGYSNYVFVQQIRIELDVLGKRIINNLGNSGSPEEREIASPMGKKFELSATACVKGIHQLCEATAYNVVFHELSHVLWGSHC